MNKKLLFLSLLIASTLFSKSQVISTPNDTLVENIIQTDQFATADVHIKVVNTQNNNITYTWMLKDYSGPSAWGFALCDNNNCYDLLLGPGPFESLPVSVGDTMDMKFQFSPYCVTGSGWADVVIYITGDSANTATTFHYVANVTSQCPSSVESIDHRHISIYPNPFINSFNVTLQQSNETFSFEVIDMKGSVIESIVQPKQAGVYDIILPNSPQGNYLLKVKGVETGAISTLMLNKLQ